MNRASENNMNVNRTKQSSTPNIRWMLVVYDLIVYAVVAVILLVLYGGMDKLSTTGILQQVCLSALCLFGARLIGNIYGQVWRYGGIQCYIRLLATDSIAFLIYLCLELLLPISKIIFAIPSMEAVKKKKLYDYYKAAGYKLKVYDYPTMYAAGGKRHLREFDIEELLFRKPIVAADERTNAYYKDKVVLITGGGGSIGSELCRQLAKMNPKKIIILDIYENGAYDVQQELKIAYGNRLDLQIEICSITHKKALKRVFDKYHPQIIINAAAHKHVPLMEHNCIEAIYNNVFGTKNLVELCEEYHAERFMMVSTDKAVNPTNVMGATKRMCEMIVQSASTHGTVKYSATRFGNVLGSAGSVIPLFKRQIANGGPVTVTDKRIIRYFMTIPEASQLVLQSGAIANNGELFVLDMGQPVKIMDLADNMIRLSGVREYP